MRYVMALEGGGSKTACLIADENPRIVGHGLGGPTNVNFVTPAVARQSVVDAVASALSSCASRPERIDAVCVSHGAADWEEAVRQMVSFGRAVGAGEAEVVRVANLRSRYGVVVIAGTGSVACAVNRKGEAYSSGGWGTPLGDEGGAVDIAMKAIAAAIRAQDGRGRATGLVDEVVAYFGLNHVRDLVPLFYQTGVARHRIGALFYRVHCRAREGDPVARTLLAHAGRELGLCAAAAIRRAGMQDEMFDVAVSGGVTRAGELVLGPMRATVQKRAQGARVWAAKLQPVCGALLIALREAGVPAGVASRVRLRREIRRAGLEGWPGSELEKGGESVSASMVRGM
jgi:N-acetylglucosamine kinase-like BadF-type ATPase